VEESGNISEGVEYCYSTRAVSDDDNGLYCICIYVAADHS
jgi:hypothetical protein